MRAGGKPAETPFGVSIATAEAVLMRKSQNIRKNKMKSIEIIDKYDKYGRMLPKVHELSNVNILRDIKNIKTIIRKLIKSESGAKIKEIDSQILNGGSHYAGTCCMGCNKKNGVVDKNLKYFGINNLYICDASVIPKIGNANLSLTIVSLAIRLSDHLSNKYKRMV